MQKIYCMYVYYIYVPIMLSAGKIRVEETLNMEFKEYPDVEISIVIVFTRHIINHLYISVSGSYYTNLLALVLNIGRIVGQTCFRLLHLCVVSNLLSTYPSVFDPILYTYIAIQARVYT